MYEYCRRGYGALRRLVLDLESARFAVATAVVELY
jgi:hypothetical protein